MIDENIIGEIDRIHLAANDALKQKQFNKYMSFFADTLQYKQLDGKLINKKKLSADIRRYFDRIKNFSSEFERVEISFENNQIVTRLIQYTKVSLRVFIFFTKSWTVEREGIYTLEKNDDSWKIAKVEIIKEKIF